MGEPEEVWLQPWCKGCEEHSYEGRQWCSSDAWGTCDECDAKSVRYVPPDDSAYAKGFAAGLEAGAEMAEAEVRRLATSRIGIPHSGDDEHALRQFATALRERATHEKQMAISKILMDRDAEILRGLAGTEEKK